MDEHLPPLPSTSPRTSALAIWSLVLGILGLTCFSFLTGIPAIVCGHKARGRISRSSGTLTGEGIALAGLITGYVGIALALLMFPLLLAIAIPNFVKARESAMKNACITNLQQIEGAKEQWALENKKQAGDLPQASHLFDYLNGRALPLCPSGGTYSINATDTPPTCTIPGHEL
jgi:uncharacterized membrane protein (UPF0136 family)